MTTTSNNSLTSIDDWSLEKIQAILDSGQRENQFFDFKLVLPDSRNETEKHKLRKDLCAFANTFGGALIVGVNEADRTIPGVSANEEIISRFNELQKPIFPSISYQSKTIQLPDGRLVYIFAVTRSSRGPHSFKVNEGWIFEKRMPGSNATMTYDEIKMSFMLNHEKLAKLDLLKIQLIMMQSNSEGMVIPEDKIDTNISGIAFDLTLIHMTIADTYSLISKNVDIIAYLSDLLRLCTTLNFKSLTFATTGAAVHGPAKQHNLVMNDGCRLVGKRCNEVLALLKELKF